MMANLKNVRVLVAVIAVLTMVVGTTACSPSRASGDHPTKGAPARALTAQEQEKKKWVEDKARESGGDFTKLSAEDRQRLVTMLGTQAPFSLRQVANTLNQKK